MKRERRVISAYTNIAIEVGADTRRGILSMVASVYDPFGFISPNIQAGKRVLQEMCK